MKRSLTSPGFVAQAALALSLFGALVAPRIASADDSPMVSVSKDGTVDGSVVVGAPPDVVQSYLSDVAALRKRSKDVVAVEVQKDGACELVTTTARSFIEVVYVSRRCPSGTGWVETLLESDTMNDYYAEWFVTPVSSGIEVRFRMRTDLNMVPSRLVRAGVKSNVQASLELMQSLLGGPDAPPDRVAAD